MSRANTIEVIEMPIVLNILPIALEIEKETLLFAIVYQMPVSLGSFIDDFFY